MATILRAALVFFAIMSAAAAHADDIANSEALRIEIENLRETGRLSIGGVARTDTSIGYALSDISQLSDFRPQT